MHLSLNGIVHNKTVIYIFYRYFWYSCVLIVSFGSTATKNSLQFYRWHLFRFWRKKKLELYCCRIINWKEHRELYKRQNQKSTQQPECIKLWPPVSVWGRNKPNCVFGCLSRFNQNKIQRVHQQTIREKWASFESIDKSFISSIFT